MNSASISLEEFASALVLRGQEQKDMMFMCKEILALCTNDLMFCLVTKHEDEITDIQKVEGAEWEYRIVMKGKIVTVSSPANNANSFIYLAGDLILKEIEQLKKYLIDLFHEKVDAKHILARIIKRGVQKNPIPEGILAILDYYFDHF